ECVKEYRRKLEKIDSTKLDLSTRVDYRILEDKINARLLELEQLRPFENNPSIYCESLSHTLLRQALFDYAPAEERLADIIAKEEKIPRLCENAKRNLKNPPPVFIDIGLLGMIGTLSFIECDLPNAFAGVGDQRLIAEFQSSTETA